MLETTRGLIGRIEKAKSAGADKAALMADLKQWAGTIPEPPAASGYARWGSTRATPGI